MNINLQDAVMFGRGRTEGRAQEHIEGNAEVLQRSGDEVLTGRVALISEGPDFPGSYRVYHEAKTDGPDERWIWVDPDGVQHSTICPCNDPEGYWP